MNIRSSQPTFKQSRQAIIQAFLPAFSAWKVIPPWRAPPRGGYPALESRVRWLGCSLLIAKLRRRAMTQKRLAPSSWIVLRR